MKRSVFILLIFSLIAHISQAQISGCTDPLATNFNSLATQNDGSCLYSQTSLSPVATFSLTDSLKESSGLILWEDHLFSQNDDTDKNIYKLDTNGLKIQTYSVNIMNKDWEEIAQDNNYLYIGDFGNNAGNRIDLRIFRISKSSFTSNPVIDVINFSYSDQTSFPTAVNNNDFDCEAFVVSNDSIYLFTKRWISGGSGVYSIPKTPGTYSANLKFILNLSGLITGASFFESKKLIVLSGYSGFLQPFVFLLYDYNGSDFSSGNKRKIDINLPFHQVEAITSRNGLMYFLTNEHFSNGSLTTEQKLVKIDLGPFLSAYLNGLTSGIKEEAKPAIKVFPNPAKEVIYINAEGSYEVSVLDALGVCRIKSPGTNRSIVSVKTLPCGVYTVYIVSDRFVSTAKLIVE